MSYPTATPWTLHRCAVTMLALTLGGVSIARAGQTIQHLSLPPAAFRSADTRVDSIATACGIAGVNPAVPFEATAPVFLPDGAVIVGMRAVINDTWPLATLSVSLRRVTDSCLVDPLATVSSLNLNGSVLIVDGPAIQHTVDNSTASYIVVANWPSGSAVEMTLRRVRIDFMLPDGPPAATCTGDINGDNQVNGADLSVLLARFGSACTP